VRRYGAPAGELVTAIPGRHVVLNALAAAAVCLAEGVEFGAVREAVAEFKGARRRFEPVGDEGGVTVMDDYAHHPTEVRATIAAARERFAGRRLLAIYQPHTYSRIAYLWDDWLACWAGLDALVVLETYAAREQPAAGRSAADLAAAITNPGARYAADFDEAIAEVRALARPGDVVFTIGAGDVNEAGPRLLEALR
jgi:UDP-N-acetylmuramate--alanine ligase